MPGHWGRPSRPSRGSPHRGGGGGPPSILNPPTPTPTPVTTGGPPSILSRQTPVTTAKGPPSILSRQTPVTTAKGPPSILSRPTSKDVSPFVHKLKLNQIRQQNESIRRRKSSDFWNNLIGGTAYYGTRGLGIQPRYAPIWNQSKYIKDGLMNVYSGTSNPNLERFTKTRTKGLSNLDDWAKFFKGQLPFGGSEGVYFSPEKTVAKGYAAPFKLSDPSTWGRGSKLAKEGAGKIFEGKIPANLANLTRNMYGQVQGIMSSDLANKAYGLAKNVDLSSIKSVAQPISKFLGKAVPYAGAAMGITDAALRAKKGDWFGAALSAGSAVPLAGLIPLAAQVGTDYMGWTGKKRLEQAQGGIMDLYRGGGFSG